MWGGRSGPRRVTVGGVVCGHRGRYTQKQCATLLPLPGNSDGQVAEDEDALMLLMEEDGKLGRPMSSRGPGGRRHRWPWCLPGPSGRGLLAALGNLPAAQPGSESALSSAQRSRRHCSGRGLCTRSKANGPCARPRPASVPACPPRVKGAGLTVRGWAGLGGPACAGAQGRGPPSYTLGGTPGPAPSFTKRGGSLRSGRAGRGAGSGGRRSGQRGTRQADERGLLCGRPPPQGPRRAGKKPATAPPRRRDAPRARAGAPGPAARPRPTPLPRSARPRDAEPSCARPGTALTRVRRCRPPRRLLQPEDKAPSEAHLPRRLCPLRGGALRGGRPHS